MPRTPSVKTPTTPVSPGNYPVIKGPKAITAVENYVAKTAALKVLEGEIEMIRDYLLEEAGDAPVVHIGARTVTITSVPEMPAIAARKITKEMIGQELPGRRGRKGYKQVRVA